MYNRENKSATSYRNSGEEDGGEACIDGSAEGLGEVEVC